MEKKKKKNLSLTSLPYMYYTQCNQVKQSRVNEISIKY